METILSRRANILSQAQREAYFTDGFVGVEGLVGDPWLGKLQDVTAEFIDISRNIKGKDRRFDLEPNHSADEPRIRRLNSPTDFHETYWEFASQGPFVDIAEDLLGPNVKFHHSKLNFKWSGMVTLIFLEVCLTPFPPQSEHGFVISSPLPEH